jgi:hypothetical protein
MGPSRHYLNYKFQKVPNSEQNENTPNSTEKEIVEKGTYLLRLSRPSFKTPITPSNNVKV